MSHDNWKSRLQKAALDILWSHWIKLGAYVEGAPNQASGDVEALLILSAMMADHDKRLVEVMGQWLHYYESVVNIERLKTAIKTESKEGGELGFRETLLDVLVKSLPHDSLKRWGKIFALLGGKKSALHSRVIARDSERTRKKLQSHESILKNNMQLGFRYVWGATAKADIIYFLSVYLEQPRTVGYRNATGAHLSKMLHYDPATVLRSLEEFKNAGIVTTGGTESSSHYVLNPRSPLLTRPPQSDRFYLDWWTLFPVYQGLLTLEKDTEGRHEILILDNLNARLQDLETVLKMIPRPVKEASRERYGGGNLQGIEQHGLAEVYVSAFEEIRDSIIQPRVLDWGADELTEFLDHAQQNLWASYAGTREFRLLMKIDDIYGVILPLMSHQKNWFEALFLKRSHSYFRAAVRLAASGQLPESFALMRLMLESALYSFHIHRTPELKEVWMEKNRDHKAGKAFKENFKITHILNDYEKQDAFNGKPAKELYKRSIEYGGHPNFNGLATNLVIETDQKNITFLTLQLNTNELPLKHALVSTARTGLSSLLIFEHIYSDRFQSSGVSAKIRELTSGL